MTLADFLGGITSKVSPKLLASAFTVWAEVQADPELKKSVGDFGRAAKGFLRQSGLPIVLLEQWSKGATPTTGALRALLSHPDVKAWVRKYGGKK